MKKPIAILTALMLLAAGLSLPIPARQNAARIPGIGGESNSVTWSFIQSNPGNCANPSYAPTTYSCQFNLTTVPGDLLIMDSVSGVSAAATTTAYTLTTGDSTWTPCPASGAVLLDVTSQCAYILSAAGGASTFTVTYTAVTSGTYAWVLIIDLIEVRRSSGTATYVAGGETTSTNCGPSCTSPALTLTGASDYINQFAVFNATLSAGPGGAYTHPADLANNSGLYSGFAGALNQSSGAAVTWAPSAGAAAVMSGVAFK